MFEGSFEDKIAKILAGDFTPPAGSSASNSKNPTRAPSEDAISHSTKGIAVTTTSSSFFNEMRQETFVSHSVSNMDLTYSQSIDIVHDSAIHQGDHQLVNNDEDHSSKIEEVENEDNAEEEVQRDTDDSSLPLNISADHEDSSPMEQLEEVVVEKKVQPTIVVRSPVIQDRKKTEEFPPMVSSPVTSKAARIVNPKVTKIAYQEEIQRDADHSSLELNVSVDHEDSSPMEKLEEVVVEKKVQPTIVVRSPVIQDRKKTEEFPPMVSSPATSKAARIVNPKVTKIDSTSDGQFSGSNHLYEKSIMPVSSPLASPSVSQSKARIVNPNAGSNNNSRPNSRTHSRDNSITSVTSITAVDGNPRSSSSSTTPIRKPTLDTNLNPSDNSNPNSSTNPNSSSTHFPSDRDNDDIDHSLHNPHQQLESPSRFSTPSKAMWSSPNSASSSVAGFDRSIVVAVRVRPFNSQEKNQKARRTISKAGNDLVLVNPKAFDAEPDMVATAAIAIDHNPWAHAFRFDQCLWSYDQVTSTSAFIDQEGVHEALGYDIVDQALNGLSCSCFAYGHTSTGKTYSLFGKQFGYGSSSSSGLSRPPSASSLKKVALEGLSSSLMINDDSGLVPRVFHDIITAIKTQQITPYNGNSRIFMSFLEVYNEKVIDLLGDNIPSKVALQSNGEWLKVREHPSYGPYVENLKKVEIFSVDDMFSLLAKGCQNRSTAQTYWNNESSRSHAIVTLELASFDLNAAMQAIEASYSSFPPPSSSSKKGKTGEGGELPRSTSKPGIKREIDKSIQLKAKDIKDHDNYKTIRIQMIDLAGSEKEILSSVDDMSSSANSSSKSNVWSGSNYHDSTPNKSLENQLNQEKAELKAIRRSLATLGYIIQSLGKGASFRSLPYRDSKLTFLLRDALRGSNHTTMLATISPSHTYYEETLATLRYAEKLCILGKKVSINAGTTSIALPARDDRPQMIEDFRRYHNDVESVRKASLAAKQLLQFRVSDPQQRIQRVTKIEMEFTSGESSKKHNKKVSNADFTFTSPLDGKIKCLSDLTKEDLDTLQSTYRSIQGQVIELQIDLDAVKTDRDTLLVELKAAKEQLKEVDYERQENNQKITNYLKSLKLAEKEVNESRILVRRKDEHIERLITELNETKQSKHNSEQAYHARTKEFLVRFDNLKK
jgi:hypothetical protein